MFQKQILETIDHYGDIIQLYYTNQAKVFSFTKEISSSVVILDHKTE